MRARFISHLGVLPEINHLEQLGCGDYMCTIVTLPIYLPQNVLISRITTQSLFLTFSPLLVAALSVFSMSLLYICKILYMLMLSQLHLSCNIHIGRRGSIIKNCDQLTTIRGRSHHFFLNCNMFKLGQDEFEKTILPTHTPPHQPAP